MHASTTKPDRIPSANPISFPGKQQRTTHSLQPSIAGHCQVFLFLIRGTLWCIPLCSATEAVLSAHDSPSEHAQSSGHFRNHAAAAPDRHPPASPSRHSSCDSTYGFPACRHCTRTCCEIRSKASSILAYSPMAGGPAHAMRRKPVSKRKGNSKSTHTHTRSVFTHNSTFAAIVYPGCATWHFDGADGAHGARTHGAFMHPSPGLKQQLTAYLSRERGARQNPLQGCIYAIHFKQYGDIRSPLFNFPVQEREESNTHTPAQGQGRPRRSGRRMGCYLVCLLLLQHLTPKFFKKGIPTH